MAAIVLAFAVFALVARRQPVSTIPRLILSVGSTFAPLVAVACLVLAMLSRRVVLSIFAVFLVTTTVAIQVSCITCHTPLTSDPTPIFGSSRRTCATDEPTRPYLWDRPGPARM